MEAHEGWGLQDDRDTDQPARTYEQRTQARNHSISETEVGGTSSGAIEHQQLLLDQDRLGHHATRPARTGEPGDSRQDVEKQDGQVAHGTIVTIWRNPRNANELGIRHAQVRNDEQAAASREIFPVLSLSALQMSS